MKNTVIKLFVLISILVVCVSAMGLIAYGEEDTYSPFKLRYNNQTYQYDSYYINGSVLVPINFLNSKMPKDSIYFDTDNKKAVILLDKGIWQFGASEVDQLIKDNIISFDIPYRNIENEYYIPINNLKQLYDVEYTFNKDILEIKDINNDKKIYGKIIDNAQIVKPSLLDDKSINLTLSLNETVEIIDETVFYYQVKTSKQIICFVKKKSIALLTDDISMYDYYYMPKEKKNYGNKKINVLWEYVYALTPKHFEEKEEGIDVVSPTWFYINEEDGTLVNKGDIGYTEKSHELGYEVWGLMTNRFDTPLTTKVLNDEKAVNKVLGQILLYAVIYDLDGINIDFEYVADADRDALTAFMEKLTYFGHQQGLVISIDVTIPKPWTIEYNRKALSEIVDYVMIMTYDEHWRTGSNDGSIASYPWVETAILDTLKEVSPEKLVMGIPLYTRVWQTDSNGNRTNYSISMAELRALIEENNYEVSWLDNEKQYYISFEKDGISNKVWIEDQRSIANKLLLVEKYNLAGTACWRRGFEEAIIWDLFEKIFGKGASLADFIKLPYEIESRE